MTIELWRRLLCGAVLSLLTTISASAQWTDVTATSGLTIPGQSFFYGLGACTADFDGDGDMDIIATGTNNGPLLYFRNDGGMTFTDRSAASGLGIGINPKHFLAFDADGDRDVDLFLVRLDHANQLFINDGTGTFTEEAAARGLAWVNPSWNASAADIDNDGDLDLFVGTRNANLPTQSHNRLYLNDGLGYFTDISAGSGIEDPNGLVLVSVWFDHDEDGLIDLLIGNDKGAVPWLAEGSLYKNLGGGVFTNIGPSVNARLQIDAMGVDVQDVDCDGDWDFYCTDSAPDHVYREWDASIGRYQEKAVSYGIGGGPGLTGWAAHFLDVDNDGWQDLHVVHIAAPNALYMNPGGAGLPWSDVAPAQGLDWAAGQYIALRADFDDDGRMDLLDISSTGVGCVLRRNVSNSGHNYLKVSLRGHRSNTFGIGATIEVETPGHVQKHVVTAGCSYLATMDVRRLFGLGTASVANRITVRWPSGVVQTLKNVPGNQHLVIEEPHLGLSAAPAAGSSPDLMWKSQGEEGLAAIFALAFTPAPGLPLPDGRVVPLALDPLFALTASPNPILWPNVAAIDPATGLASCTVNIPPGISGALFFASSVTLDPLAPIGIGQIAPPLPIFVP